MGGQRMRVGTLAGCSPGPGSAGTELGKVSASIKCHVCSPASQLTSSYSFSLSTRRGNTAELIHRAFAELNISKALCHSLGLRMSKYQSVFRQRASGCQGI